MSDTDLPCVLLATTSNAIVRVMLPGKVPFDTEFSVSPAGVTSVSAKLLLGDGLRVTIVSNGFSVLRMIPESQLPAYQGKDD